MIVERGFDAIAVEADWLDALQVNNQQAPDPARRVGFYGIDLYSLHKSMQAVVPYLDQADPEAAGRARGRCSCFDHVAMDPQRYGYLTSLGLRPDREVGAVR
ncbi:erythromycin esterase-like protein [Duganella sp. 1224]|uniref:erythromycin esterase family protein n=1 Tax=Duganella sp. 1224 TaxID=2587052 RepID=UPI00184732D1|nr:erythromycin esterase family protein [Duganella sp. 1224]NYE60557.1 erythromycin esterase-like protein [Duganella sp. 1224]